MSNETKLPTGATVVLKDPKNVKVKDRKRVLKTADVDGGDLTKALALGDALIAMLVESWSFDLPIPADDITSIDELDPADFDFLLERTKEAQKYLFPTLNDSVENEQDPKAITENSKG